MIGARYGRLVVMARVGQSSLLCRCSCGAARVATAADLERGHVKSCGCLKRDAGRATHREPKTSPEYIVWSHMKRRGYKVCPEWAASFPAFLVRHGAQAGPGLPPRARRQDRRVRAGQLHMGTPAAATSRPSCVEAGDASAARSRRCRLPPAGTIIVLARKAILLRARR
jgi:hypothetical protein